MALSPGIEVAPTRSSAIFMISSVDKPSFMTASGLTHHRTPPIIAPPQSGRRSDRADTRRDSSDNTGGLRRLSVQDGPRGPGAGPASAHPAQSSESDRRSANER